MAYMATDRREFLTDIELPFVHSIDGVQYIFDVSEIVSNTFLVVVMDGIISDSHITCNHKVLRDVSSCLFPVINRICPSNFITNNFNEFPLKLRQVLEPHKKEIEHRTMLVKKAEPILFKCFVTSISSAHIEQGIFRHPVFSLFSKVLNKHISFKEFQEIVIKTENRNVASAIKNRSLGVYEWIFERLFFKINNLSNIKLELEFGFIKTIGGERLSLIGPVYIWANNEALRSVDFID